ncbi:MAG: MBL fold metallo-hydrolase, partial [Alphaproteobacteria bacterium]|nr:MBL fold metallo-hydrolase [Alphaproteobacteria bacterium]
LLVDCGLFQGLKQLRLKNWAHFPIPPASIAAVLVTHAHIDHTGYLPLLVRNGFAGPIYCSEATADLCGIMLPDAAHLQEKDAEFANRRGFSKHKPALPLYTINDALRTLELLKPVTFDTPFQVRGGASVRLRRAGHILGAASLELSWHDHKIVFSGDIGRYDDPLLPDPQTPEHADTLLVESTYGDRLHGSEDIGGEFATIIGRTMARGGTLIIPAFAVGRAQLLLYHLWRLKSGGRIARELPIYMDSPMAIDASDIFRAHSQDHKLSEADTRAIFALAHYVREPEQSKALTADSTPKIILSASGMASGGRVLHHLKHYAPDARNAILFAGFQAAGTRGAALLSGRREIKIFGDYVPVRADVYNMHTFSAHADQNELMRWLKAMKTPPRQTYIVHGEPSAADGLRHRIEEELRWTCTVAEERNTVDLQ